MIRKLLALAGIFLLIPALAAADVLEPGFHAVNRKICYQFARSSDSAGYQAYAVVLAVQGTFTYVPLSSGSCVDQGYKFNSVELYWASKSLLASAGAPTSTTSPSTHPAFSRIRCLSDDGRIVSNHTQVPDSIPEVSEAWTYTVVGGQVAATEIAKNFKVGDSLYGTVTSIDYLWGAVPFTMAAVGKAHAKTGQLSVLGVRGSKVLLNVPTSVATLRVMTLSGKILRQMRVSATGSAPGFIDLGMVPPKGTFVELRQGKQHSFVAVGSP